MLKLASAIDAVNAAIGKTVAYLVYFIMAIIVYEIIMRSFFNHPTKWVHDMSSWAQVFYVFLGGAGPFRRVISFASTYSIRISRYGFRPSSIWLSAVRSWRCSPGS